MKQVIMRMKKKEMPKQTHRFVLLNKIRIVRDYSRGQILIEAIIAMGILTVAVFAIFSLLSRSISLNRVVSNEYIASYLAAEGLEVVKNIIDTNVMNCRVWNDGLQDNEQGYEVEFDDTELSFGVSGEPLIFDPVSKRYRQNGTGNLTPFRRLIMITTPQPDVEMRVVSKVEWKGRSNAEFDVELEDHFFKWLRQPAACR